MNFKLTTIFEKDFKRLQKKYPSLADGLLSFKKKVAANPEQGVLLPGGFRKIRLLVKSKGKGKSGCARVITLNIYYDAKAKDVVLVTMYDKSERESVSDADIRNALGGL